MLLLIYIALFWATPVVVAKKVGEGKGRTNAYLRAREVSPGNLVVIGTSRDRTFQAGKLLMVNLGGPSVETQAEEHSSYVDLTPDVPGDYAFAG